MAKALLGHMSSGDYRAMTEIRRLQQRVRELEAQLLRLQAENDVLAASTHRDELLTLDLPRTEPALA